MSFGDLDHLRWKEQLMDERGADPEFAEAFRAYVNYLEDLAGSIGGRYGFGGTVAAGVHAAVLAEPAVMRVSRRTMSPRMAADLEKHLRKSWGQLRRAHREVDHPTEFDEEANALLPVMSHYSVYDAVTALSIASNQPVPRDHAGALKMIGKEVGRRLFPYPWNVSCSGCPQTDSHVFVGFEFDPLPVHVLGSPDPWSSEDRLAMWLRTTRAKELERRFDEQRRKKPETGRSRRNVSRLEKERIATSMAPTTLFDVLWRMRKKASYEDADVFVLGAAGVQDARRFAESLVIVTDATVAAIEAVIGAYVGLDVIADMADRYIERCGAAPSSHLASHAASFRGAGQLQDLF